MGLTAKVSEIIPEFAGGLREKVTLYHLLTHSVGFPSLYSPRPGMYLDQFDEIIRAIIHLVHPMYSPGQQIGYSPMINHALLGEIVQRVDRKKRSFDEILNEDLLWPLGLVDTAMGRPARVRDRHIVPDFRGNAAIDHLGSEGLGRNGTVAEAV